MKRFLAFIIVIAGLGAFAGLAFVTFKKKLTELQLANDKHEIDRAFLAKLAFTRMVEGDAYGDDAMVLFSGYARDVDRIYKNPEYAPLRDDDKVRKLYAEEHKKGRKDDRTLQQVNERIDYTQEAYKTLTGGSYHPVVSVQDKGLRLDFYDVRKAAIDGQDRLQVRIAMMAGDPDAISFGRIEMKTSIEKVVQKKVRGKMVEETKIRLAKIEGSGSPNLLIRDPRKWMPDFPPGVMIGYYDFPLFPSTASQLQLVMDFSVRTVGGNNLHAEMKFAPIAIEPSWKLPEGASWEAEEIEGTEEEIAEFTKGSN